MSSSNPQRLEIFTSPVRLMHLAEKADAIKKAENSCHGIE